MKDKKFIIIYSPSKSEVYDDVQITYKPKDNKYLIHALDGKIYFKNNIKACKKKRKEIRGFPYPLLQARPLATARHCHSCTTSILSCTAFVLHWTITLALSCPKVFWLVIR